jgi:hypothetical protein
MVTRAHPWKLVAPWWKWARAAHPADGRGAPAALLKFSGDEFVKDFVADPQHSLVFDPQVDVVSRLDATGAAEGWMGKLAARVTAWSAPRPLQWIPLPKAWLPLPIFKHPKAAADDIGAASEAPSFLRKLFLPAHDRHYLVACELHCDVPGFPSVDRAQACQAGFVVRRRTAEIPDALAAEAAARTAALAEEEAKLAVLEALDEDAPPIQLKVADDASRYRLEQQARVDRREELRIAAGARNWPAYLASQRDAIATQRQALGQWFADEHVAGAIQGWAPGVGWVDLDGDELIDTTHRFLRTGRPDEQFFPLVPLVQDPRGANQDARGRTIYYGVVPTVMGEHDNAGHARFDAKSTYEIRCFVRRHDASKPRTKGPGTNDCCGEVTWSAATEPFRLAPPFDLLGTAQRPITIQMPDLKELAAQVKKRPRGKLSPVKFVQPQHMSPSGFGMPTSGMLGGPAICFFSIPLITIVALFVLNIFLPIVVVLFNLWFLLALQFCIAPKISVAAGASLDVRAKPPGVDVDASVSVGVIGPVINAEAPGKAPSAATLQAMPADDLQAMAQAFADNAAQPQDPADAQPDMGYREQLVYEPRREPQWSIPVERRA